MFYIVSRILQYANDFDKNTKNLLQNIYESSNIILCKGNATFNRYAIPVIKYNEYGGKGGSQSNRTHARQKDIRLNYKSRLQ